MSAEDLYKISPSTNSRWMAGSDFIKEKAPKFPVPFRAGVFASTLDSLVDGVSGGKDVEKLQVSIDVLNSTMHSYLVAAKGSSNLSELDRRHAATVEAIQSLSLKLRLFLWDHLQLVEEFKAKHDELARQMNHLFDSLRTAFPKDIRAYRPDASKGDPERELYDMQQSILSGRGTIERMERETKKKISDLQPREKKKKT
jgi:hypothetical protein